MEDETYAQRQQDELEFLQFVFMDDFEDLRKNDTFKVQRPPEIQIKLLPQKSISTSLRQHLQVSIKLYAKYSADYPDTPPELKLLEPNHLSESAVKELLKEINDLAKDNIGEVMMLEIAQHIQKFLHKHDKPPVSLYEEMVRRREREAEEESQQKRKELDALRWKEQLERQDIEQELKKRQAEFMEKVKQWQESEESDSESDASTHDLAHDNSLLSGCTDNYKTECEKKCINILRGKCLGDSTQGGYSLYSGMDCDTGQLVTIYEWTVPCKASRKTDTRRIKQVSSIKQEYDSFVERSIKHTNLVQYFSMNHQVTEQCIIVEVVVEHVSGGNLTKILRNSSIGPLSPQTLHYYSKQLVEAVSYLHSQGIVHNDIRPSLIFIDSEGGVKLGGHSIVKRLTDLCRTTGKIVASDEEVWPLGFHDLKGGKKADILKLGLVIYCMAIGRYSVSYPPYIPDDFSEIFIDFLKKCLNVNEYQRYPAHELLVHPFITLSISRITPINNKPITGSNTANAMEILPALKRNDISINSEVNTSCLQSRLEMEFEVLETLGKGGFGDVIKVRNYLDGRLYAIKRVKLIGGRKMMAKLTREVELLSQMNHENVVRYYNAWIEVQSSGTNEAHTVADNDDYSDSEGTDGFSDDEDDCSFNESDGTSFIEFCSNTDDTSTVTQVAKSSSDDDTSDGEDVFTSEYSADTEVGNSYGVMLEADIMDITPRRLKRSDTESSEAVVFQDSSSNISRNPDTVSEENARASKIEMNPNNDMHYLYIQMEFCANQTLRQLIDSGQIQKQSNFELGWQLFREITEGLAHIHNNGMIHRDLKPGNIFLNSSGHIKIGDFGLATTFNKHPAFSRQNSITPKNTSILAGDTGLVGTTFYLAPELFKPVVKYSQKVDIYSLGIIFYEMSHVPVSTLMERAKILTEIRKKEIVFSDNFDAEKMRKQAYVIKWLLNHSPSERPTSNQLLNSPHIPFKIEDEQLQEVIIRTLQNPSSARYRHLMKEIFSQQVSDISYITEHEEVEKLNMTNALLQQFAWNTTENIFIKHCGWHIQVPLFEPDSQAFQQDESVRLLEPTGKVLSLPHDHWISFCHYILDHDITYLKRYDFFTTYNPSKVPGIYQEIHHYVFDIVSPSNTNRFVSLAELISIIFQIFSTLQMSQVIIRINHTALIAAVLTFCSVAKEQHGFVLKYLYKLCNGKLKNSDVELYLKSKLNLQLSPLAMKTLVKLVGSQVPLEEAGSLLEPLLKSTLSVSSVASDVLDEIRLLHEQLSCFQIKLKILFCPGLVTHLSYFEGLTFHVSVVDSTQRQEKKRKRIQPLAVGGVYNRLLETLSKSRRSHHNSINVCGMSVNEDVLLKELNKVYEDGQIPQQISKVQGVVCMSLSTDSSLFQEGIKIVEELRDRGAAVDLLESIDLENIQELCRQMSIPHIIILDNTLLLRQQVKLRTLDISKEKVICERVVSINELCEYIQPRHGVERSESNEGSQILSSKTSLSYTSQDAGTLPPVTITTVGRQKLQGTQRRRMDSQTLSKLLPLLKKFSSKLVVEIIAIDFELDALCLLAAEINKAISQGLSDYTPIVKLLIERDNSLGKKYVAQVCESIQDKINKSYVVEQCQVVLNNSYIVRTT